MAEVVPIIYDKISGGFSYWETKPEDKPDIAVDTEVIGYEAPPWMFKVAMLELGEGSTNEVIQEVLHYYSHKFEDNSGWLAPYNGRPKGKKTTLLDKIKMLFKRGFGK